MKTELNLLEEMIDSNGIDYISKNPFEVYERLIYKHSDPVSARLILVTLLAETAEKAVNMDQDALSEYIQEECCLNMSTADELAELYAALLSKDNIKKWKANEGYGLKEFSRNDWHYEWECTKEYHQSGSYVDCTC